MKSPLRALKRSIELTQTIYGQATGVQRRALKGLSAPLTEDAFRKNAGERRDTNAMPTNSLKY